MEWFILFNKNQSQINKPNELQAKQRASGSKNTSTNVA